VAGHPGVDDGICRAHWAGGANVPFDVFLGWMSAVFERNIGNLRRGEASEAAAARVVAEDAWVGDQEDGQEGSREGGQEGGQEGGREGGEEGANITSGRVQSGRFAAAMLREQAYREKELRKHAERLRRARREREAPVVHEKESSRETSRETRETSREHSHSRGRGSVTGGHTPVRGDSMTNRRRGTIHASSSRGSLHSTRKGSAAKAVGRVMDAMAAMQKAGSGSKAGAKSSKEKDGGGTTPGSNCAGVRGRGSIVSSTGRSTCTPRSESVSYPSTNETSRRSSGDKIQAAAAALAALAGSSAEESSEVEEDRGGLLVMKGLPPSEAMLARRQIRACSVDLGKAPEASEEAATSSSHQEQEDIGMAAGAKLAPLAYDGGNFSLPSPTVAEKWAMGPSEPLAKAAPPERKVKPVQDAQTVVLEAIRKLTMQDEEEG